LIREVAPSVIEFYRELIDVKDEVVRQILNKVPDYGKKLKLRSFCISLSEINLICEGILANQEEIQKINPEVVKNADRALFYDRQSKVLGEKPNPNGGPNLKPHQAFVIFYEITFPPGMITEYLETFLQKSSLPKNAKESELVSS